MPTSIFHGVTPPPVANRSIRPLLPHALQSDGFTLRKGLTWSGIGHGILALTIALLCLFWPKPAVPVVKDITFTLVKNPSKTLPSKPDAKGDKPQLAGGQQIQKTPRHMPIVAVLPRPLPVIKRAPVVVKPPVVATKKQVPLQDTTSKPLATPVDLSPSTPPTTDNTPPNPVSEASVGTEPTDQLAVTPDKMAPYFGDLKKALSARWQPPRGENSLRVVTQFVIQADGRITDIEIMESSGDPSTDTAARQALEASSPLAALPEDWGVSSVPIRFSFDYTVFGKSRPKKSP